MAVATYDFTRNIFQKHPEVGSKILVEVLMDNLNAIKATQQFNDAGIEVTQRTIERHIKKMKGKIHRDCKSTSSIIPEQHKKAVVPYEIPSDNIQEAIEEYEKNTKGIKEVDPIKIMDKSILLLEIMLSRESDFIRRGAIMDLQMKYAEKLQRMRPSKTDFDLNSILRRNDWGTEFIIEQSMLDPGSQLKEKWLEFLSDKQSGEVI